MENKKINSKKKKGFTLIELIIVIAILGILTSITIPKLSGIKEDAKEKADLANAKIIANTTAILIAQDKITGVVSASNVNSVLDENTSSTYGNMIEKYLDSVPKPQSGGDRFAVEVSSGSVTVYAVNADIGNDGVVTKITPIEPPVYPQ